MKKLIAIFCLITIIGLNAMSQDLKGKVMLSATMGGSIYNTETVDVRTGESKSFTFSIPAGYFISNKFAVGLVGSYSYQYYENKSYDYKYESNRKSNSFLVGPFVRSYFPISEKLLVFIHLETLYGKQNTEYQDFYNSNPPENTTEKKNLFNATLYPGLSYKVSNKVLLEAGFARFNYSSSDGDITNNDGEKDSKNSSSFNFMVNYISFGLTLVL